MPRFFSGVQYDDAPVGITVALLLPLKPQQPPAVTDVAREAAAPPPRTDRMAILETEVAQLRQELEELKQQFAGFRKQFE